MVESPESTIFFGRCFEKEKKPIGGVLDFPCQEAVLMQGTSVCLIVFVYGQPKVGHGKEVLVECLFRTVCFNAHRFRGVIADYPWLPTGFNNKRVTLTLYYPLI